MTDHTYRIGQPLVDGQSHLHVFRPRPGVITIQAWRADGMECCNVSVSESPELSDEEWEARIVAPALAALEKHVAEKGWTMGKVDLAAFRNTA